jgi:hypothetical protein
VSRSQMLAAMVATTPTAPEGLSRMLRRYLSLNQPTFSASHPHGDLPEVAHRGRRRQERR